VLLEADNFKYFDGTNFVGDVREKDNINNPNHYVVHPAFSAVRRTGYTKRAEGNFGNTKEIPGFWVSKFEMGPDSVSKPNISSQRDMTISDMFTLGRNLSTKRGITDGDSNAMTNTQWGAVAYLARGIGKEPVINASNITGGGDYKAKENVEQSTTGNVTGVYDMSGCAWETMSTYIAYQNNVYTDNLVKNKDTTYVDVYANAGNGSDRNSNYLANADKYGDAIYEVTTNGDSSPAGWSGDLSYFLSSIFPVFCRGGFSSYGINAGVFAFDNYTGNSGNSNSWRGVCTVESKQSKR
ncbi:MAG: hypothetical protein RSB51_05420, partial [Clostridia bacterium]